MEAVNCGKKQANEQNHPKSDKTGSIVNSCKQVSLLKRVRVPEIDNSSKRCLLITQEWAVILSGTFHIVWSDWNMVIGQHQMVQYAKMTLIYIKFLKVR